MSAFLITDFTAAQAPPLTLGQAVDAAVQTYPAVRSSLEQVSAAGGRKLGPHRADDHRPALFRRQGAGIRPGLRESHAVEYDETETHARYERPAS